MQSGKRVRVRLTLDSIQLFSETFNALPLAHVIENKILVVHGGLFSKDDVTLDDIRKIDRLSLGQPGTDGKCLMEDTRMDTWMES